MRKPNAAWDRLAAISRQLADADDATTSVVIETIPADIPYNRVLSTQQAWLNKYARCAARGLIEHPFRIRRERQDDGSYIIEAALDLTAPIEGVMAEWPDPMQPR